MQFYSLLITALTATFASGVQADCPSQLLPYHITKRAIDYEAVKSSNLVARSNIDINVYMHNVASGKTYDEAYVSDDLLQEQFDVIHEKFLPYGIEMHLAGMDHTINKTWANVTADSQAEADMKNALHKGDYTDINIYIVNSVYYPDRPNDTSSKIDFTIETVPIKGYSHFPEAGEMWLSDVINDGVVITYKAASGSTATGRDKGITAIHEIGHWFGLEHTFARGCVGLGDGISDTPVEDLSSLDTNNVCPESRDTCPGQEGSDPIHNYMDTTSDECRTEFTDGQVERMHTFFKLLRVPKAS